MLQLNKLITEKKKNNSLNSLNKYKKDFVSNSNNNNDLGKRNFATFNKQNNILDVLFF